MQLFASYTSPYVRHWELLEGLDQTAFFTETAPPQ